jgi:outer membrane protein assembly factor BamB
MGDVQRSYTIGWSVFTMTDRSAALFRRLGWRQAKELAGSFLRAAAGALAMCALVACLAVAVTHAEDWPEFRGKGRIGVWTETGILDTFPKEGLKVLWRTPVRGGYAGPAVADGRVFVVDYVETKRPRGTERALALDEKTGRVLWTREWDVNYGGIRYAFGPRATPTVDGDRVYAAGSDGKLFCLDVRTGAIIWKKDYVADLGAEPQSWGFPWGFSSAPIVDGTRLIALVGGRPNAAVVAFDKMTGKEIWRALELKGDLGVAQPIIITAGGTRQLIVWLPTSLVSLDPATGKTYWDQATKVGASMTVATPVQSGSLLFVSSFYNGGVMMVLDDKKPAATLLWQGKSDSEIQTDTLHSVTATPVVVGDHIYGLCSYGQFRCLLAKTGARLWESQAVTKEHARWAAGQIVRHGERLFINNDRGELLIVKPSPQGYQEISRTPLIKPTTDPTNRRELVNVNWSHPAYANRRIYARNDEEIIAASLAADGK